ncbi:MAG: hypothetical protein OXN26_16815, partial [Gammaproteobacteria bacterium]|nr:hypothetical protein [Gammaproteobacteria bacterium]
RPIFFSYSPGVHGNILPCRTLFVHPQKIHPQMTQITADYFYLFFDLVINQSIVLSEKNK